MKPGAVLYISGDAADKVKAERITNVVSVLPDNEYQTAGITIKTVPAYNLDKAFHQVQ